MGSNAHQESVAKILDVNEAPNGYIAVLKSDTRYVNRNQNICRSCDWRPQCNDPASDLTVNYHRCMSYTVITTDGREIKRNDGCSVVFKKRPTQTDDV